METKLILALLLAAGLALLPGQARAELLGGAEWTLVEGLSVSQEFDEGMDGRVAAIRPVFRVGEGIDLAFNGGVGGYRDDPTDQFRTSWHAGLSAFIDGWIAPTYAYDFKRHDARYMIFATSAGAYDATVGNAVEMFRWVFGRDQGAPPGAEGQ